MKAELILLYIFCLLSFGCGNDKTVGDATDTETTSQKRAITTHAIENLKYTDYVLSNTGEEAVASWDNYQELAIQIGYLKKADISFFNGDKELLKKFVAEFKIGLPEDLNTNPILSRMAMVETSILKLHDDLTLDNIPDENKLQSVKEVIVAFSNFNYQINKKLERDKFDKISSEY
ncbi:hypothetical protein [Winogradskyella flava]|uniref:hypothetical protein n=1 Tax=Winogradskyella flava TaxID=1884876 RepID=UPI002491B265|nr:hypothetical protein [Winogradskyella flava]